MSGHTYPKAQAPLTWTVLAAANARAERWKARCDAARVERDRLQRQLDAAEEMLDRTEAQIHGPGGFIDETVDLTEERDRWKERWEATVKDADEQRARADRAGAALIDARDAAEATFAQLSYDTAENARRAERAEAALALVEEILTDSHDPYPNKALDDIRVALNRAEPGGRPVTVDRSTPGAALRAALELHEWLRDPADRIDPEETP